MRWRTLATYIRPYSVGPDFRPRAEWESLPPQSRTRGRALGTLEPVKAKAHTLLKNLAAGLEIFGSRFFADRRASDELPGVMVGETERTSDLSCFNDYYGGSVQLTVHPHVTALRG